MSVVTGLAGLLSAALLALTAHLIRVSQKHSKALEAANRNMEDEIRERKLAEKSLVEARQIAEEASRAKSDFLARMSHEIRSPLNAILGMASLLWDSRLDDEQRKYVSAFRRAGDNLLTLINDILDLSKIEAGQIDLQSVDFELDELVATALDLMRVRTGDKGLDIVCELSPEIRRALRGDPDRLRQVLINLLGNAVKFTDAGQVCLRIEQDEREPAPALGFQTLRFSVSDTGPGIPLGKQSLIFETFTQADGSISRQYGGTGLGLTISRQIVERLGGRLEVSSRPGKGSTFSFAIRFALAVQWAPRPDSASSQPSRQADGGLNILLVEDSRDNQLLISAYLKQTGNTLEKSRVRVRPSKEVEELAPWYLDKRRSDLVALVAALQAGDYDAIRVMGHNMKGSGAGYGFDAIARIGASLEAAAKKKSDGPIGTEISALGDYLDCVEVVSG